MAHLCGTLYLSPSDDESPNDRDVGAVFDFVSDEDSDDVSKDSHSEFISEHTSNAPGMGY